MYILNPHVSKNPKQHDIILKQSFFIFDPTREGDVYIRVNENEYDWLNKRSKDWYPFKQIKL